MPMFANSKYTSLPTPSRLKVYLNTHEKGYNFSFNGKEKDNETYGEGNAYDFGARIYDARLGRWMSTDRIANPNNSVYNFCRNSPIILIDADGRSDYYSPKGVYLGSDGTAGTDIFIIHDKKLINKIYKQNSTALKANPDAYVVAKITLQDGKYFKMPSFEDRQQIKKEISEVDNSDLKYYEIGGSRYIDKATGVSTKVSNRGESKTIQEIGEEYNKTNNQEDYIPLDVYVGGNSDATGYEYTWHMHTDKIYIEQNLDGKWNEKPRFSTSNSTTIGDQVNFIGGYKLSKADENLAKYSKDNFLFTKSGDEVLYFSTDNNIRLNTSFFFNKKSKEKGQ